jgi:hypothetical protein
MGVFVGGRDRPAASSVWEIEQPSEWPERRHGVRLPVLASDYRTRGWGNGRRKSHGNAYIWKMATRYHPTQMGYIRMC